jgi:hypothetical protein
MDSGFRRNDSWRGSPALQLLRSEVSLLYAGPTREQRERDKETMAGQKKRPVVHDHRPFRLLLRRPWM